jgi:methionyl aminopeptidase
MPLESEILQPEFVADIVEQGTLAKDGDDPVKVTVNNVDIEDGEDEDDEEGDTVVSEGAAKKKKKKKNKKKKKAASAEIENTPEAHSSAQPSSTTAEPKAHVTQSFSTVQSDPPSIPVRTLFPAGSFPEGEWQSYKQDNLWRESSAEKREQERLQWDMLNQVGGYGVLYI